jgi:hypothetical protein
LEEAIDFFHPADREKLTHAIQRALDVGEPYDMEIRFITAQGEHLWVRTVCHPQVVDGRTVKLRGTFQDITARKRAEQAIAHYMEELERSNGELQQFAYVVSHDLKAPLRAIKGFLDLLQVATQGQLDARAEEYVHFAVDGAARMEGLIGALLDYARVDTRGRDPVPTDVEAALADVLETLKFSIEEREAQVTHDPLPTVLADPTQLAQLLQNLIGNALKFSDDASPRVHITAAYLPPPTGEGRGGGMRDGIGDGGGGVRHTVGDVGGGMSDDRDEDARAGVDEGLGVGAREAGLWRFAVRDNGIGIAPAHHDRIFAIFQRLHTREEYEGTGIGLAICKKIVERHGGRIWVESALGEGATFYFTLPSVPHSFAAAL